MQLSELSLDRFLYKAKQTTETQGATETSADNAQPPSTAVASGNATTDVNNGSVQLNGEVIEPGTIPAETLDVSNWGWTQTCVFTSASATQVNWGAGSFISANGVTYAISGGNTGVMAAKTYIYLDLNVSSTTYQHTTTSGNAVGVGKVLVAVAQNGSASATFNLNVATQIVGDNILANTIDASKITAGSITATQISASYVYAGTISADNVTAGTLTGSIVRTSSGNDRVQMDVSSNSLRLYSSNVLRASMSGVAVNLYNTSGTLIGGMSAGNSTNILIDTAATLDLTVATNFYFGISSIEGLNISRTIRPLADANYDLGTVSEAWLNFWLSNGFVFRGVVQPLIYFGYCSSTTVSRSNSSFTLTNPSTGKYTLTHGFGTTNYTAVATVLRGAGAGAYSIKVEAYNSNSVQFTVFDDTGTVQNSDFTFLITKI